MKSLTGKSEFGANGKESSILKKIDLPIVPFNRCNQLLRQTRLGETFNLDESFTCAGGELNKDACKGDGGSGLICKLSELYDQYYQAGIVSWGVGCGQADVPGVYVNVAKFVDWINEQIQLNKS